MISNSKILQHFKALEENGKLTGIYDDIPDDVYNDPEFPGVRSSFLKKVAKKSYHHALQKDEKKKDHLEFGRGFHSFMEGLSKDELYRKYRISNTEYEQQQQMANSIKSHPRFEEVYAHARREITMFAKCPYTGQTLRCRLDLWTPETNLIADYKSVEDASFDGFSRSARRWGYRFSACFYAFVVNLVTKEPVDEVRLIAVEKAGPYFSAQYFYSSESFELDTEMMVEALRRVKIAGTGGNIGYSEQVIELRY
jgi:hypothetical protein